MAVKKRTRANDARIVREEEALATTLAELPTNPIPWASVITIVAPILARLAVRYALKRTNRTMSDDKVNAVARSAAGLVAGIIAKRVDA